MFKTLHNKKIAIHTLGCKVNQYESDSIIDMLINEDCELVEFTDKADFYIINTCSVTNMAERKSRQIIHRAKKLNSDAIIVACGCYVQAAKAELEADLNIDIIIGNNRKKDIARLLSEYVKNQEVNDNYIDINNTSEYEELLLISPKQHTRAYVKVQDGCNNFCTYCIIPYARGRVRSRDISDVIEEITNLAKNNIKEVVITGINLPSYEDSAGNTLLELLQEVSKIDGINRIRMGSLEPRVITKEFLEGIYQNKKICPHFHLSLQSACNDTLKRMNRKYTIEEYIEKCDLIRKYYDRPAITTDVIVGFPGETDEEFDITCKNLLRINCYEMHIFKYSKRKGTPAATYENQVPEEVKNSRSDKLLSMTERQKAAFEDSFKGEDVDVLIEKYEEKNGEYYIVGHTDRYINVRIRTSEEEAKESVNKTVTVRFK